MSPTVLILAGIALALCILYPIIIWIASKPCYRVKRHEHINNVGRIAYRYTVEQRYSILSFTWWQVYGNRFPLVFENITEAETRIKQLLHTDTNTVSNVICKGSPEVKATFQ